MKLIALLTDRFNYPIFKNQIPMLPRPLCEIACSLNENVERLAFSCVWRMNRDGSIVKGQDVWYGRTVIKVSFLRTL